MIDVDELEAMAGELEDYEPDCDDIEEMSQYDEYLDSLDPAELKREEELGEARFLDWGADCLALEDELDRRRGSYERLAAWGLSRLANARRASQHSLSAGGARGEIEAAFRGIAPRFERLLLSLDELRDDIVEAADPELLRKLIALVTEVQDWLSSVLQLLLDAPRVAALINRASGLRRRARRNLGRLVRLCASPRPRDAVSMPHRSPAMLDPARSPIRPHAPGAPGPCLQGRAAAFAA